MGGGGGGGERERDYSSNLSWTRIHWRQKVYHFVCAYNNAFADGGGEHKPSGTVPLGDTPCAFNAKSARNSHFIHGSRPEKLPGSMCSNNKNFESLCIKYLTRGAKGVQP